MYSIALVLWVKYNAVGTLMHEGIQDSADEFEKQTKEDVQKIFMVIVLVRIIFSLPVHYLLKKVHPTIVLMVGIFF